MSGYGYYLYCCEDCKKLTKIEHGFSEVAQKEIIERQNSSPDFSEAHPYFNSS